MLGWLVLLDLPLVHAGTVWEEKCLRVNDGSLRPMGTKRLPGPVCLWCSIA